MSTPPVSACASYRLFSALFVQHVDSESSLSSLRLSIGLYLESSVSVACWCVFSFMLWHALSVYVNVPLLYWPPSIKLLAVLSYHYRCLHRSTRLRFPSPVSPFEWRISGMSRCPLSMSWMTIDGAIHRMFSPAIECEFHSLNTYIVKRICFFLHHPSLTPTDLLLRCFCLVLP